MSVSMNSADAGFFTDDEKLVSEILLDLPYLISECERRRFPFVCWRNKRKRSVLEDSDTTTTTTSSPASVQSEEERCVPNDKRSKSKNVDTAVFAAPAEMAANSPCTPLAFPSSESEEHKSSKQSNSKKRTREELLGIIDGLNHQQELLKGEILNMRNKHFKLCNTNKELKAKKEELSLGQETEKKPQLRMNAPQLQEFPYGSYISGNFQLDPYGQRTPMGLVNGTCLLGASSQPLDLNRMLMRFEAAKARRTRMMKIKKAKNQRRSQSQHLQGPSNF